MGITSARERGSDRDVVSAKHDPRRPAENHPPSGGGSRKQRTGARTRGHAAGEVTSTDEAMLELKEQRDALTKASRRATRLMSKFDVEARRYLHAEQRQHALRCVKRRRLYQAQLDSIAAMQGNVEQSLFSIESALVDAQVVGALRAGGEQLRVLVRNMGDVERTMDDVADAVADARAIQAMVGEDAGLLDAVDEDALERELMKLAEEEDGAASSPPLDTSSTATSQVKVQQPKEVFLGPDVPTAPLPPVQQTDLEEPASSGPPQRVAA